MDDRSRALAKCRAELRPLTEWFWDALDASPIRSRNEVAKRAGYDKNTVYAAFEGQRLIGLVQARDLADALGADLTELDELWNKARRPFKSPAISIGQAQGGVPIDQMDPHLLEVHRAVDAPAESAADLPLLPVYVERDHDRVLAQAVEKASGGSSVLVTLVGGSSVGKSRACWEAARKLTQGWQLWHPKYPNYPQAVLEGLPQIAPRMVLWLNDAQHYLLTSRSDQGERVAAGLRELISDPGRRPVLILATLWQEHWDTLTKTPLPGGPDPHMQARKLLDGTTVRVPPSFTGTALAAVRHAAAADSRIALAIEHTADGRICQFLAGVPELLDRYYNANAPAAALIHTAMDARCLGHGLRLPRALLEAAAPGYPSDRPWADEAPPDKWLEKALAYCAAPCKGSRGPITPIRPLPNEPAAPKPEYRLADYLEQMGHAERANKAVPVTFWDAAVQHAQGDDSAALGHAARCRGFYLHAVQLYIAARTPDAISAAMGLLREIGRTDEGIAWLTIQANAGNNLAYLALADALRETDRTAEALEYYRRAADAGDPSALRAAAALLTEKSGRPDEAVAWLGERTAAGDLLAPAVLADVIRDASVPDDVITSLRTYADAGDSLALTLAAELLEWTGRADETHIWLKSCADERYSMEQRAALDASLRALRETGRIDKALAVLKREANGGDSLSLRAAADLLNGTGRPAISLQTRRDLLDSLALSGAARLMSESPHLDAVIVKLKAQADAGDLGALRAMADLLKGAERADEALHCYHRAANAGDGVAVVAASGLLWDINRFPEAMELLLHAADAGDACALQAAADLLYRLMEGPDGAVAWLTGRTHSQDPIRLCIAADLLLKADRVDEALEYYHRAAEEGTRSPRTSPQTDCGEPGALPRRSLTTSAARRSET
jgi:tetratricopeptide (TPR) repeat protein